MTNLQPKTRTVTLNGQIFEYVLSGKSTPIIVFLNGFKMPLSNWRKLYPEIEKEGTVFAYNRHGIGNTSKASCPQTGQEVVETLRELLTTLELFPPYTLIAHSIGGIFANLYARLYPSEVSAVIFVDATHPDEPRRQSDIKLPLILRAMSDGLKPIEYLFDKYKNSEIESASETMQQIEKAGDFPPIPLSVITGNKKIPFMPEASFSLHLQCQKELLELSPNSKQFVANQSSHFPHLSEPEMVLAAINETIAQTTMMTINSK